MSIKIKTLILILILLPNIALAAFDWGECPFGNVDDPYPGMCGRFRDLDSDGICDLSQTRPEDRGTVAVVQSDEDIIQDKYNVILITILVFSLYGLTQYFTYLNSRGEERFKFYTQKNVRWIWNVVLLWSFIVVFITSIILLCQLSGWLGNTKINYSFWHIEAGLVMGLVTILHFLKRWKCFIK